MNFYKLALTSLLIICLISCGDNKSDYVKSIEERREITNEWMINDPNSPFNFKGNLEFDELNYFDVDSVYIFRTNLIEYEIKDTIQIFGTKGEERTSVRFGYLPIEYDGKNYKLNVYESPGGNGDKYYSIWFTDKTTNKETYGVGRYLSFELNPDPDHIYSIDFNLSFNPYCAYNSNYSCAIPTKEDYLDFAINAGEKKYHD